jgi:cobalt-zinc-cadmium efflux system protein
MTDQKDIITEASDKSQKLNLAFLVGISLNFTFVVIEVIAGLLVNSLSLLSDAGHNLADVVSLLLSLLAFRLMKVQPNERYTYGYRKTSILAALFNTMFLLVSIGAIIFEALHRLFIPVKTTGSAIAVVAGIGIIINGLTAFMFLESKEKDLNVKSAYLHMLSDAMISAGIVVAGIMIHFTAWYWLDSLFSIIVSIVIIFGTWKLMRSSLRLSLDGVPGNINIEDVRNTALKISGIKDIHHIHVWAISTTENALTAHLILRAGNDNPEENQIKNTLKAELGKLNIHHVTLETEKENSDCETSSC